jgi:hypothetical protein
MAKNSTAARAASLNVVPLRPDAANDAPPGNPVPGCATLANHASPRTTKLYDRRSDEISLDEVEKIAI